MFRPRGVIIRLAFRIYYKEYTYRAVGSKISLPTNIFTIPVFIYYEGVLISP